MLKVRDLWVTYNRGVDFALQSVSLSFMPGTLNLLWGANGSGKSTFLRALAGDGALDQTSLPCSDADLPLCKVSYVAQRAPFAADDRVLSFFEIYRVAPDFNEGELERLSCVFGIAGLIHERLGALSGGQWKRVQCCAQLSLERPLYLLDEPDAALDRSVRAVLAAELSRKAREWGATVLVASHHTEWLRGLTDSLTVFKQGRVVWHSSMPEGPLARQLLADA
jgi:heme exporter protein A